MAVVYYQLFVLATLGIVRIVFPARLLSAALIWSCLTAINLFYPPLIIIQLVVIWGGFALLNSSAMRVVTAQRDPGAIDRAENVGRNKSATRGFAADFNSVVEVERETRATLNPFKKAIDEERAYINSAMEAARGKGKYNKYIKSLSPENVARIEQIRGRLDEVFEDQGGMRGERPLDQIVCADLSPPVPHPNPKVARSVELRLGRMLQKHAEFLAATCAELEGDAALRPIFEEAMRDIGGLDLLNRIRAFEARAGWRSLTDLAAAARSDASRQAPPQPDSGLGLDAEHPLQNGVRSVIERTPEPRSTRIKITDRDEKVFLDLSARELIATFESLATPKEGWTLPGGANVHFHRLPSEDDYYEELAAYEPLTDAEQKTFWIRSVRKARWKVRIEFCEVYGETSDRCVALSRSVKDRDSCGSPAFSSKAYGAKVDANFVHLWLSIPNVEVAEDFKHIVERARSTDDLC